MKEYKRHVRIRYRGAPEALPGIVHGLQAVMKPTAHIRIGYVPKLQELPNLQQQQLPSLSRLRSEDHE